MSGVTFIIGVARAFALVTGLYNPVTCRRPQLKSMLCAADLCGLTSRAALRRSRSRKVAIRHAQVQACVIMKCLANSEDRVASRDSVLALRPRPSAVALDELVMCSSEFQFNAEATCFYPAKIEGNSDDDEQQPPQQQHSNDEDDFEEPQHDDADDDDWIDDDEWLDKVLKYTPGGSNWATKTRQQQSDAEVCGDVSVQNHPWQSDGQGVGDVSAQNDDEQGSNDDDEQQQPQQQHSNDDDDIEDIQDDAVASEFQFNAEATCFYPAKIEGNSDDDEQQPPQQQHSNDEDDFEEPQHDDADDDDWIDDDEWLDKVLKYTPGGSNWATKTRQQQSDAEVCGDVSVQNHPWQSDGQGVGDVSAQNDDEQGSNDDDEQQQPQQQHSNDDDDIEDIQDDAVASDHEPHFDWIANFERFLFFSRIRSLMFGPPHLPTMYAKFLSDADVLAEVSSLDLQRMRSCYRMQALLPDHHKMNILCAGALLEKWDGKTFCEFWIGDLFSIHAPGHGCGSDYYAVAVSFMQKIGSESDPRFLTSYIRETKTIQQQSDDEACGDVSAQNQPGQSVGQSVNQQALIKHMQKTMAESEQRQRPGAGIDSDSDTDTQPRDDWPCFLDEEDLQHIGAVSRMHLEVESVMRMRTMEADGCTEDDDDPDGDIYLESDEDSDPSY